MKAPACLTQTSLHQIGDGSTASIRQERNFTVGCGHSRRTRSVTHASDDDIIIIIIICPKTKTTCSADIAISRW